MTPFLQIMLDLYNLREMCWAKDWQDYAAEDISEWLSGVDLLPSYQ